MHAAICMYMCLKIPHHTHLCVYIKSVKANVPTTGDTVTGIISRLTGTEATSGGISKLKTTVFQAVDSLFIS